MIDEADELPVAQVDQPLRHVVCHVDDCNLFVAWSERLVGEERVIHDPGLGSALASSPLPASRVIQSRKCMQ